MEASRAIEIVQKLADGVDPYSGEQFASDSPCQEADTVRALHLALEGRAKLKRSTARKTGLGRPRTEDEEKELLREFDDKIDVEDIAKQHERTKGVIWARLEKLGRIQRKDFPGSTPHPPRSGGMPEPTPPTGNMPPPDPDDNDDYPF